jgi:hypothetical protein
LRNLRNNKNFYTYSTAGSEKTEVVISCYSDPFVHEAWNKDKVRKISDNNPFQKRFGTMDFGKKPVVEAKVAEVQESVVSEIENVESAAFEVESKPKAKAKAATKKKTEEGTN